MTHFSIAVEIAAPPDRVWAVLSDIERWPEWTPTVRGIQRLDRGPLTVGSRARVRQPKLPPAAWQVTELLEGRHFTWVTRSPGVCVTARHAVEPAARGTRATLSLQFSGVLGPIVARLTRGLNQRYLALEAKALNERSTAPPASQPAAGGMKASVFIATSLDGFIARANGDIDWLPRGGGEEHGYEAFMATVDALVIGRKTFETVLTFDAWPYGGKPVYVLSTRALAPAPSGAVVERMSGAPTEIVSQLAARGVRHAYVDGGITIQGFLQAGLIQRLIITRIPVLIGAGVPLFGATPRDIALRHLWTRQYASGLVQSEYEVAAPADPPESP